MSLAVAKLHFVDASNSESREEEANNIDNVTV